MSSPHFWVPNADVLMSATGELVIKVELAALSKENLEITVEGQRFTLTGRRADPDGDGAKYLVKEISHGRFESVVDVPEEFDASRARAEYQNGILRIVVPPRIVNRLRRS